MKPSIFLFLSCSSGAETQFKQQLLIRRYSCPAWFYCGCLETFPWSTHQDIRVLVPVFYCPDRRNDAATMFFYSNSRTMSIRKNMIAKHNGITIRVMFVIRFICLLRKGLLLEIGQQKTNGNLIIYLFWNDKLTKVAITIMKSEVNFNACLRK